MSHVRAVRGERSTRDPSRHTTQRSDWRPRIRDRDSFDADPKSLVDYVR